MYNFHFPGSAFDHRFEFRSGLVGSDRNTDLTCAIDLTTSDLLFAISMWHVEYEFKLGIRAKFRVIRIPFWHSADTYELSYDSARTFGRPKRRKSIKPIPETANWIVTKNHAQSIFLRRFATWSQILWNALELQISTKRIGTRNREFETQTSQMN